MKRIPQARWLAGILLVLVLAPAVIWWWTTPHGTVRPVQHFLPDHLSGILRVRDFEQAWHRHWSRREGPEPEDAVRHILEVLEEWEDWIERYGETGAQLRISAYQKAVFEALGGEASLMFGEWGAGAGGGAGTGQAGLIILTRRGDSPLKARLGPIIELILKNYHPVDRSEYRDVELFEYKSKRQRKSFTYCAMDGWIVASLRQRGPGPLPALIDTLRDTPASQLDTRSVPSLTPMTDNADSLGAVTAAFVPDLFWGHLRQFGLQRGKGMSKKSERRLRYWQQRLEGVERAELAQTGASLFNLRLSLIGERPALLTESLLETQNGNDADKPEVRMVAAETGLGAEPNDTDPASSQTLTAQTLSSDPLALPDLVQLDLALPFARLLPPLIGFSAEELLEKTENASLWLGELPTLARAHLASPAGEEVGRIGLAAYLSATPLIPSLLLWRDRPPMRPIHGPPGHQWAVIASPHGVSNDDDELEDQAVWLRALEPGPETATYSLAGWDFDEAFADSPANVPLGYLTFNFYSFADGIKAIPPILLLDKKNRRKVRSWRHAADALALALGAAAFRLDAHGDRWVLTLRTL